MRYFRKFLKMEKLYNIIHNCPNSFHSEFLTCSLPILRSSHKSRFFSSCNHFYGTAKMPPSPPILYHYNVQKFLRVSYSMADDSKKVSLTKNPSNNEFAVSTTTVTQKVKETSATMFWISIILAGLTFAVSIFYVITVELFSSNSAQRVYSKALKYISNEERVMNEIGDQIKGFGEETRRGRRQHISHIEYNKDGRNHLRMKFYIKGSRGNGTVHLEMIKNNRGDYEYRYLFVVIDSKMYKTIILEDNRNKYDGSRETGNATDLHNLKELDLSMDVQQEENLKEITL